MDAGGWAERNLQPRVLRSRLFLEGMQRLGLQVANVSSRELMLGPQILRTFADSLGIQMVSANILSHGKPLFHRYVVVPVHAGGRDLRVGVTGITVSMSLAEQGWPPSEQLEVRDPLLCAIEVLPELQSKSDVQVLLAYLPATDLDGQTAPLHGYEVLVCGTGDLRDPPKVGSETPVVVASGVKAKYFAWVALQVSGANHAQVVDGRVQELDTKVPDDPEGAKLVQELKARLGPSARAAATAPSTPATPPGS